MEADIAWAAGFFDGEGTIYVSTLGGKGFQIQAGVSQNDPEALYKFKDIVGFGEVYHSKCSKWLCGTCSDVEALYELLFPYLCSQKRRQFEYCLNKFYNRPLVREIWRGKQ